MGRLIVVLVVACIVSTSMGLISKAHSADLQMVSQLQCNERDKVHKLLARKYKEVPIAVGVTVTGGLLEVLSDYKSGTWTIIVTTPQGMSCLVAAGEGWRDLEEPLDPDSLISF